MEIYYERTINYLIRVTPETLLKYARNHQIWIESLWDEDKVPAEDRTHDPLWLEDIIDELVEGEMGEEEVGWGRARDPHFDPDAPDPFEGGTIQELEENLKQFKEED
ncbi:MAG: hypothetical protein CL793_06290 [Chloroflexi bacterium]|nr:hypothetical protein [Chloroflexota bacterium]|tara:strand:- start:6329 stop:6649 length:321 start_codon:yes stop_codon:yes gene_type:complete